MEIKIKSIFKIDFLMKINLRYKFKIVELLIIVVILIKNKV